MTIYTIGHSNRPIDEFLDLLTKNRVRQIVDIRKIPKSRRNPQFAAAALQRALEDRGIAYAAEPRLGGRRPAAKDSVNTGWRNASFRGYADYMATSEFSDGLHALMTRAKRKRTAIMCAEAVPWRCHRMLVADALKHDGCRVLHIIGSGRPSEHRYTPFMRVRRGVLRYPEDSDRRQRD